jgi:MFS family permease
MSKKLEGKGLVLSLVAIVLGTFFLSLSMGVNSVILPFYMEGSGEYTDLSISLVLAAEFAAGLFVCFTFPKIIKKYGLLICFIISTLSRVVALYIMSYNESPLSWFVFSLLLGAGNFSGLLIMQTWVNSLPRVKYSGLMTACYGTAISVGAGSGPLMLNFIGFSENNFLLKDCAMALEVSAIITFVAIIPILMSVTKVPQVEKTKNEKIIPLIKNNLQILLVIVISGASFYGVSSYIVIYGVKNNIPAFEAALLLSAFMIGSLFLESPLAFITDFFNRNTVVFIYVGGSMLCSVCLPMLIYYPWYARALLFVWGGITGALFSSALAMTGDRFEKGDQVTANCAVSLMENVGALSAVLLIGTFMKYLGSDGLPYTIMVFAIGYISYMMIIYRVK